MKKAVTRWESNGESIRLRLYKCNFLNPIRKNQCAVGHLLQLGAAVGQLFPMRYPSLNKLTEPPVILDYSPKNVHDILLSALLLRPRRIASLGVKFLVPMFVPKKYANQQKKSAANARTYLAVFFIAEEIEEPQPAT